MTCCLCLEVSIINKYVLHVVIDIFLKGLKSARRVAILFFTANGNNASVQVYKAHIRGDTDLVHEILTFRACSDAENPVEAVEPGP